jgi:hypothetical protein
MSWKSPTGHSTPTNWVWPEWSYDEDIVSFAYIYVPLTSWSNFLELLMSPAILCNKIRFYIATTHANITLVDIDIYYKDNWYDVYEGTFTLAGWNEKIISGGSFAVSKTRIRFYNSSVGATRMARLHEFDFNQLTMRPLVNGSLVGNSLVGKGLVR